MFEPFISPVVFQDYFSKKSSHLSEGVAVYSEKVSIMLALKSHTVEDKVSLKGLCSFQSLLCNPNHETQRCASSFFDGGYARF